MSAPSTIGWVAERQSAVQHLPFIEALHSSNDLWSDLVVEENIDIRGPGVPSELPLGHVVRHVLVVPVRPHPLELRWAAGASYSGTISPGTLTIFPANQPYRAKWLGGSGVALQMSAPFAAAAVSQEGEHSGDLEPVFAREDPFVTHAIHTLHNLARLHAESSRLCGETLGLAVAAHVVKEYGVQRRRTAPVPAPLDASALHRIDQFIDRHLDSHVSVDELAALVGMGVFRFWRLFKLATGKPPYQHILHKRIERAKSILAEQSVSISDVASSCGFASQSHFTDVFRRTAGVTPRRFAWVARGGRNILTDARSRR